MVVYADRYSWRGGLGEHFVAHHDGTVSMMIQWDGECIEMLTQEERLQRWRNYFRLLAELPQDVVIENHFWRGFDRSVADDYLAQGQLMVRAKKFGAFCRNAMYDHLAHRGMSNTIMTVFSIPAEVSWLDAFRVRKHLKKQRQAAQRLLDVVHQLRSYFPGIQLCSVEEYAQAVHRSYSRDFDRDHLNPELDQRFHFNHQWVSDKPVREGDLLKVGNTFTKVAVLFLYPDALPGWFESFSNYWGVELHVSQVVQSIGAKNIVHRTEMEAKRANHSEHMHGATFARGKHQDLVDFKDYVADNDLAVLRNVWIIHIHSKNRQDVLNAYDDISKNLNQGGQLRDGPNLDYLYWRVAMPGMGYQSDFMREDDEHQVASMMPIVVQDAGLVEPSQLRLSTSGQLVGLSNPKDSPNHSLNIAKTNSGKGVEKVVQICETYPLGEDWYIIEVGTSYEWVVEAFGGGYIHIDPEEVVPNPFPAFADLNKTSHFGEESLSGDAAVEASKDDSVENISISAFANKKAPLPGYVVAPTMASTAFILTGGKSDFENPHQRMVAEMAMQLLYLEEPGGRTAPNMEDYLNQLVKLKNDQDLSDVQRQAALRLGDNLDSFLGTKEGSIFTRPDNFTVTQGITGVDLDPLVQASMDKMAAVYLVNIALRYKQMALATLEPAHILMDELHEISRTHPEVVRTLIRQISRMGRRQAAYVDAISQEERDLTIDPTFARQCLHKTLLYMEGNHTSVREALEIPTVPFQRWANFGNPEGKNYRPAIRSFGRDRYFDLFLTFPESLIHLAESSPSKRKLKAKVAKEADDIFERLELFRKYDQQAKVKRKKEQTGLTKLKTKAANLKESA